MEWHVWVVVLLALFCVAPSAGVPPPLALERSPADEDPAAFDSIENDNRVLNDNDDEKLEILGKVLANILVKPWPNGISPIVYIEDDPADVLNVESQQENEILDAQQDISQSPYKRSRYYRKYPWKRQNSRYDAENRYLCQPSKDDVFRLLVALHEARQGNRGRHVHFCNRKRPASAVFTNIRFLG